MSASEIETNETLVSADTDLTKLSAEELLAVVAELRQENKVLKKAKDKVGLTFKRVPEDGNDSIFRLEDSQFPFLTKVESLSITKPEATDGNIALIEGENLAALATLQMTHKEKVDVIYIDPPYNTGNDDFIYEDKRMYKSDEADLENLEKTLDGKAHTVGKDDPFRHSKWLSFMERRLFLAKELLSDTGVIFVSIDENEQARLKLLMDSIFGTENFVANIVWDGGSVKNTAHYVSVTHEYALVYFKNSLAMSNNKPFWRTTREGYSEYMEEYTSKKVQFGENYDEISSSMRQWLRKAPVPKRLKAFNQCDARGPFASDNMGAPDKPETRSHKPLMHPITKKPCPVPVNGWRFTDATLDRMVSEEMVVFGKDELNHPLQKSYLDKVKEEVYRSVVSFPARSSTHTLEYILGRNKFGNPKNIEYIKSLIALNSDKDSIILDFFAGSGTTGHAVAELNKEDGGNRSAILVTNNEGGIARNVTRERLARVLTGENWADGKEHEALPGNLSYYRLDFKKLSANPLSTAQMMESKFDGLLSLENNALTVVENDPDEDYAIYRNSGKVVFVWKNLFSLYDGECEELLESLKGSMQADEFIAYVPSDSLDAGITVDGWTIIPFPHDYINRYEAMIATMRRNKTLPNSK